MPKWDFNKVALQFIEITLRHGYSPAYLQHIFRTSFLEHLWTAASDYWVTVPPYW